MLMRALRHDGRETQGNRHFCRLGAAALLAGTLSACLAPAVQGGRYYIDYMGSVTREYGRRDIRQVRDRGTALSVMFLESPISELIQSKQHRRVEDTDEQGNYGNIAVVERMLLTQERDSITGAISRTSGTVGIGFLRSSSGDCQGVVAFPSQLDLSPQMPDVPGRRVVDGRAFAEFFRARTGRAPERVKLIVETTGTSVTAHAIPVDGQGRPAGRYRGGVLAFGMTYMTLEQRFSGGIGLLIEPGGRDPIDGAQGPY